MKTLQSNRQQGFATLIVMIIAALMGTYVLVNTKTLSTVKRSLQTVEKKQLRKFEQPASRAQAKNNKQ